MKDKIFEILSKLNDKQREALLTTEGPVLVIAGAGSGKTRVLTYRISYLIYKKGVPPENILAVTFTNKATNEMRQRLFSIVGSKANRIWINTFHAFGARILRQHYDRLGYRKNFVIYDKEDQNRIVKNILKELDLKFDTSSVMFHVLEYKKHNVLPDDERYREVVLRYVETLRKNNAMDFDDLLVNVLKLFKEHPDINDYYARKFRYIHIDEYQDTSPLQYEIIKRLLKYHRNIFAVGDEDQSIYSFRGADFHIILNFERDFPDAKVIKLEQNYRSTKKILELANRLIRNNTQRRHKKLWTDNEEGVEPKLIYSYSDKEEARKIVNIIKQSKRKLSDFAILYRVNALSRAIEEAFISNGISYNMVGGFKFYERREVKDIIAYLRLIYNPKDDVSFERIINVPPRGIGSSTLKKIKEFAKKHGISYYEALKSGKLELRRKTRKAVEDFVELIEYLRSKMDELSVSSLAEELITEIDYIEYITQNEDPQQAQSRLENIEELVNSMKEYDKLSDYLESISLMSEQDEFRNDESVKLMTIHSAKGLEFPVVILIGLEENILPHFLSMSEGNIEEERRLLYVGITRAMEELYLSFCERRTYKSERLRPSRFLREIFPDFNEHEYMDEETSYVQEEVSEDTNGYFREGDLVKHNKFGVGRIIDVDGDKVKVLFQRVGIKTLLASVAKLEKLN